MAGLPNPCHQILEAGKIIQFDPLAFEGPFVEVDMRIDKPRQHQATVEIDLFGIRTGQVQDIVIAADSQNLSLPDGNRLCNRLPGILRGNGCIEENKSGNGC